MLSINMNKKAVAVACAVLFSSSVQGAELVTPGQLKQVASKWQQSPSFAKAVAKNDTLVAAMLQQSPQLPVPNGGGGSYAHETHKANGYNLLRLGWLYQIHGDQKYLQAAKSTLLAYANDYSSYPLHPDRKPKAKNPGRMFWQSLNEAVWLVHAIQGYDLIKDDLTQSEQQQIRQGLWQPMVKFLAEDLHLVFNKIHNHGTWHVAAVGLTGLVLDEPKWVKQSLLGLDESGKGGLLKQIEQLFSPDGYYAEGPYYQRYALLPFITLANALEQKAPEHKVFDYQGGRLAKAITTAIELSYQGDLFPLNDAVKPKRISTPELVLGAAIAYDLTGNKELLDIAASQQSVAFSYQGFKLAKDIDANLAKPYQWPSKAYLDGAKGDEGALGVFRTGQDYATVYKATSQGMGHGHFDKLNWMFYHNGTEVLSDYGAARFLNVQAKNGGRYLPENNSYAKQTISHNTLVVDQKSHFNGKVKIANKHAPTVDYVEQDEGYQAMLASIDTAYQGVAMQRALITFNDNPKVPLVLDIMAAEADKPRQFDLPFHLQGQWLEGNQQWQVDGSQLLPFGQNNGYQHLWLKAKSKSNQAWMQNTWLADNGYFYSLSSSFNRPVTSFLVEAGANDPNDNLVEDKAIVYRMDNSRRFVSANVLEPHGSYDPNLESTLNPNTNIQAISLTEVEGFWHVDIEFHDDQQWQVIVASKNHDYPKSIQINGQPYTVKQAVTRIKREGV